MNNGKANRLAIQTSSKDAMEEDFIYSHFDWFHNLRKFDDNSIPIHNRNDTKTTNPWEIVNEKMTPTIQTQSQEVSCIELLSSTIL